MSAGFICSEESYSAKRVNLTQTLQLEFSSHCWSHDLSQAAASDEFQPHLGESWPGPPIIKSPQNMVSCWTGCWFYCFKEVIILKCTLVRHFALCKCKIRQTTGLSDTHNNSWSPTAVRTGNVAGFIKQYARYFSSSLLFFHLEVWSTGKISAI